MNRKAISWLISVLLSVLFVVPYAYKWIYLANFNGPSRGVSEIVATYNGWELLFVGQPPFIHFAYFGGMLIVSFLILKFLTHWIIGVIWR